MSVNVVAIPGHDSASLRQQVGGNAILPKLLRNEDAVCTPQNRIDLINILAILYILLHTLEISSNAGTPPSVLGAFAFQVLTDRMLVWEAVSLIASIIDGTHA